MRSWLSKTPAGSAVVRNPVPVGVTSSVRAARIALVNERPLLGAGYLGTVFANAAPSSDATASEAAMNVPADVGENDHHRLRERGSDEGIPAASASASNCDTVEPAFVDSEPSALGPIMDSGLAELSDLLEAALDREARIIREQPGQPLDEDGRVTKDGNGRSSNKVGKVGEDHHRRALLQSAIDGSAFGASSNNAVFVPTFISSTLTDANALSSLPVVIQLMVGLPPAISFDRADRYEARLQLLLPDLDLSEWVDAPTGELAVGIVDRLYVLAHGQDSKPLFNLADVVLFGSAFEFGGEDLFDRLSIRLRSALGPETRPLRPKPGSVGTPQIPLQEGSAPGTLRTLCFDIARLNLMMLQAVYFPEKTKFYALNKSPSGPTTLHAMVCRMERFTVGLRHDLLTILRRRVQNWTAETIFVRDVLVRRTGHLPADAGLPDLGAKGDEPLTDSDLLVMASHHIEELEDMETVTPTETCNSARIYNLNRCLKMLDDEWELQDLVVEGLAEIGFAAAAGDNLSASAVGEHAAVAGRLMTPTITMTGPFLIPSSSIGTQWVGLDVAGVVRATGSGHGDSFAKTSDARNTVDTNAKGLSNTNKNAPASIVILRDMPKEANRDLKERLEPYLTDLAGVELLLTLVPDLEPVRAALHAMLPHLSKVTDTILTALARQPVVKLPPVLLVGEPGSGKTTLAEELMRLLDLPHMTVDVAGGSDGNLFGIDKRWTSSAGGVHLDLLRSSKIGNPALIIDEIDKAGGSERNGDIRQKLLGLLEPRRASSFFDPFLSTPLDMSAFNFIFTANDLDLVAAPLRNRMTVMRCPNPGPEHLASLAPQLLTAEYASRGLHQDWALPLDGTEYAALADHWNGGSLRDLKKFVAGIVDAREIRSFREPVAT